MQSKVRSVRWMRPHKRIQTSQSPSMSHSHIRLCCENDEGDKVTGVRGVKLWACVYELVDLEWTVGMRGLGSKNGWEVWVWLARVDLTKILCLTDYNNETNSWPQVTNSSGVLTQSGTTVVIVHASLHLVYPNSWFQWLSMKLVTESYCEL